MKNILQNILLTLLLISCNPIEKQNDFFSYEPDERIFTVYALMNGAGYVHDHLEPDEIRIEVTEYLDTTLSPELKQKIQKFYYSHGYVNDSSVHFWSYTEAALWLSQPPDFYIQNDSCPDFLKNSWIGFDTLVNEFYNSANIGALFDKYYLELKKMNMNSKPYADSAIISISDFCNLNDDYFKTVSNKTIINSNPLMSHWTAQTEIINDDCYYIMGLGKETDKPTMEGFLHESLHHVINPIVDSNKYLLTNTEIYDFSLDNGFANFTYNTWRIIVIESYVRFLTHYIYYQYSSHDKEKLEKMIYGDYESGFILTPYIYEHINDFKTLDIPLSDFYVKLMKDLDIEKEKKRIIDFKNESR